MLKSWIAGEGIVRVDNAQYRTALTTNYELNGRVDIFIEIEGFTGVLIC